MENPHDVDGKLFDWEEIREKCDWTGILLGNGASIAVWDDFKYPSIYDKSQSDELDNPLSPDDLKLFETLSTTNFEQVLSYLIITKIINQALDIDITKILQRYTSIQQGLIEAVKAVHIPWDSIPSDVFENIRSELLNYRNVFSTNYDLLIYWSIMHEAKRGFKDCFWNESFDIGNTEIWDNATAVYYLHGGLHLYRLPSGRTLKRRSGPYQTLLDLFGRNYQENAVPLFISEGTSDEKLNSIYRSDYLSFAFSKFKNHREPIVVFGHSLREVDNHIVSTLASWENEKIAISLLPDTEINIRKAKAHYIYQLPKAKPFFYNALTHPLGREQLKVTCF